MVEGAVRSDGVPIVPLIVGNRVWRAIIDTAFNGDLELPYDLEQDVSPRFVGRAVALLAGGQSIEEDHYRVDFPFDGQMVAAVATFAQSEEILIGTRLLRDYRLEIDFAARTVILERVA